MPPRNIWQVLWRIFAPIRRNTLPPPAHDGKVTPARMKEARDARRESQRKLADIDNVIARARGSLFGLREQREQRADSKGQEPNHRQSGR